MSVKPIVVITTGGTIGSILENHTLSVTEESDGYLRDEISEILKPRRLEVKVLPLINKNSEDFGPADWITIAGTIDDCIERGIEYIIVTHGTDTLPFSAVALGLLFDRAKVRICLTGSFLPLENPETDARRSLIGAMRAVVHPKMPQGVFVAIRSQVREAKSVNVMHWFDLKPMSFDQWSFDTLYEAYGGSREKSPADPTGRVAVVYPQPDPSNSKMKSASVEIARNTNLSELFEERRRLYPFLRFPQDLVPSEVAHKEIFFLQLYPGLDFGRIKTEGLRVLVVGLYHSGTAPSENDRNSIIAFLKNLKKSCVVLCAGFPSLFLRSPYESTVLLSKAGANIYKDIQPHIIFSYCSLSLSLGKRNEEILEGLKNWRFDPSI